MQVFVTYFFGIDEGLGDVYIYIAFGSSILTMFIAMGLIVGIYHRQAIELLALVKHDNKITDPVM